MKEVNSLSSEFVSTYPFVELVTMQSVVEPYALAVDKQVEQLAIEHGFQKVRGTIGKYTGDGGANVVAEEVIAAPDMPWDGDELSDHSSDEEFVPSSPEFSSDSDSE